MPGTVRTFTSGPANVARHLRTFGVLLLSLAGSVCGAWLFGNAGDPLFFLGVIAGIFSPAIMVAVYNLLLRFMSESA